MGRWSSTYYDEVLGSKLKSLVCGAIERGKLEKEDPAAPTISYENFVQDLDHGDSFTTMLVEILVKELAERKTRPSSTDRHLIADRTARSLRTLGHIRTFRDRSTSSRRPFANEFFVSHNGGSNALDWDVLTQGADDDDLEIEDDIPRDAVRFHHGIEQTYHPFTDSNSTSSNTTIRRSFPVQTADPGTDDDMPSAPVGFPSRRSPPAHLLARHASLSRQPSIRRAPRTRSNDFSEFTTRRRPSGRHEQASQSGSGSGSNSRAVTSGTGDSSSSMDIANLLHNHHNALSDDTDGAMPVSFASTSATGWGRRLTRVRSADERDYTESTVSPRFTPFTLHSSGSPTGAAPSSSRMHINAPRLRRGGVRAPEQYAANAGGDGYTHTVRISSPPIPGLHSLSHREDEQRLSLPRRSSSAEMEYIIQTASERFRSHSPQTDSPMSWGVGWNGSQSGQAGPSTRTSANGGRQQTGTPTNLPTPRSISPENNSGQ